MFEHIRENLERINECIQTAAEKAGCGREDITLVAVSKTHPVEAIQAAVRYGVRNIGESRVQEAESKIKALGSTARWHMVGHLQTNKARKAIEIFDLIQSVDSRELAEEINHRAAQIGKKMECLIEINSSGEKSKYGVDPDSAIGLIENVMKKENIVLQGLMTIGPLTGDKLLIRKAFRSTRELFDRGRMIAGQSFSILSMGMSADFEMAIEEGSNMIRVGTAIFGQREYRS